MGAIRLEDGWIDLDACLVRRGGEAIGSTMIEQRLLSFLAVRLGQVVGRDELLEQVWQSRAGVRSRTIDDTVRRIRETIEREPSDPVHLHVVCGFGPTVFGRDAELATARAALDDAARLLVEAGSRCEAEDSPDPGRITLSRGS